MQVTKLAPEQMNAAPKKHEYTAEELQREFNYVRSERMTQELLRNGLITVEEFNKIMQLNRQSFSPRLVKIMP